MTTFTIFLWKYRNDNKIIEIYFSLLSDTGQSKKEGALIGGVAGAVCVLAFAALGIVFFKYRVARRLMNRKKVGDLYVPLEEEIDRNNAYIQEDDLNTKEDSL